MNRIRGDFMNILELPKLKTSTKDVIELQGKYFEAKRLKQYLKLVRAARGLNVTLTNGALVISYNTGAATFNPVIVEDFDGGLVTWVGHTPKKAWCKDAEDYVDTKRLIKGACHKVEL